MPRLGELSRSSRDSFESDSDSNESWDDPLNSLKSGKNKKCHLFASYADRPGIISNRIPIRTNPGTIGLTLQQEAFLIRCLRKWLAAAARRRDGGLRNRPERSPAPAQRAQLKPGLIGGPITHPLKAAI